MALHHFLREELQTHGLADLDQAEDHSFANVRHRVVQLGCQRNGRKSQQSLEILLGHLVSLACDACAERFDAGLCHAQDGLQSWRLQLIYQIGDCAANEGSRCVHRDGAEQILRLRVLERLVLLGYVRRVRVQDRSHKFLSQGEGTCVDGLTIQVLARVDCLLRRRIRVHELRPSPG